MSHPKEIQVNGRSYLWPENPTVIVCVDGSERAYIDEAIAAGRMPWTRKALETGSDVPALSVIPSFTNPNNLSIVTGQPPAVHGISGNFFYDRDSQTEVMMNDPKFLRAGTIMAGFQEWGAKVCVITAKDKLRKLLGNGLKFNGTAVCFSSERCDQTTLDENGIEDARAYLDCPVPDVYSADLSEVVFKAGVKLLRDRPFDLMYLSTTDFIQHKYAPGDAVANDFYGMMDGYWAQLDAMGATLVLTADHGMNPMHHPDGSPNVVYLQPLLDELVGAGRARVILPITDPYVVHHGALGGFATAYLPEDADVDSVVSALSANPGFEWVGTGVDGCARFGLPEERLGDIIAISARDTAVGSSPDGHDLSQLKEPLRSHGGLSTQAVPMIVNRKLRGLEAGVDVRNFDAFNIGLNHAVAMADAAS